MGTWYKMVQSEWHRDQYGSLGGGGGTLLPLDLDKEDVDVEMLTAILLPYWA